MATAAEALAVLDFIMDDTDADLWHDLESSDDSSSSDNNEDEADEIDDVKPNVVQTEPVKYDDDPSEIMRNIETYTDCVFKEMFRVNRYTASVLIEMYLQSYTVPTGGGGRKRIGYAKEMYLFLRYIASVLTFYQISDLFHVSRSAAWNVVVRVSTWIVSIGHEFITWPEGEEMNRVELSFLTKKSIPGVIGAIDGTHFHIKKPHENEEQFLNSNKQHSLILQAIVDTDLMFRDIHCGEPGSLPLSEVLTKSQVYTEAVQCPDDMFPNNTFIIGSSAYPNNQWLVTPFTENGLLDEQQTLFNEMHASARSVVHQAFRALKLRFQRVTMLKDQRNPNFSINIVVSACVLQNICVLQNDQFSVDGMELDESENVGECLMDNDENDYENQLTSRRDELFSCLAQQNVI